MEVEFAGQIFEPVPLPHVLNFSEFAVISLVNDILYCFYNLPKKNHLWYKCSTFPSCLNQSNFYCCPSTVIMC